MGMSWKTELGNTTQQGTYAGSRPASSLADQLVLMASQRHYALEGDLIL